MGAEAKAVTHATTGGESATTQQAGGGNGQSITAGFDVTRAFFGGEGAQPDHESAESGAESSPEITEGAAADPAAGSGAENAGDPESETSGDSGEIWQFDGTDYTAEQVSDALKQRGMYERFNQTITPLIQNVNSYEEVARRLSVMAQTEAEKEIAELQRALSSGKLESREYQQAHVQLTRAQQRLEILNNAAEQESAQRQKTLTEARTHNARQIGVGLIKSGWTMNQINTAQALAQEFMTPEQFADSLSTGLMEVLKDAAELRQMKEKSAAELRSKATKAVKVNNGGKPAPARAVKGSGMGSSDWISKNFWGR
jgi:hypothetical protein